MIKQLEARLATQKETRKQIEAEIKAQTEELQHKVEQVTVEIKNTKLAITAAAELFYSDDKNHIIERFWAWVEYANKSNGGWIIDDGPVRAYIDGFRYETIDLLDIVADSVYNIKTKEDFDNWVPSDNPYTSFKTKDDLVAFLEDAIQLNTETFIWDW